MSTFASAPEMVLTNQFQPKARVEIAHDFFINTKTPQPNRWWRFWQWALLGWTWKAL